MDLHGLVEIDVLILHEPARQAGADGDQCNVESAALLGALAAANLSRASLKSWL